MFDFINMLLGRKTTSQVRESRERERKLKRDAEMRKSAEKAVPRPQRQFIPRPDANPEFYARNGQAKNEAEAQRMVNEYRQKKYPGSRPLSF